MDISCSEFSLLVFAVHAYCLDINYAGEIPKFECDVLWVVTIYVIFFQGIFEYLRGPWAK